MFFSLGIGGSFYLYSGLVIANLTICFFKMPETRVSIQNLNHNILRWIFLFLQNTSKSNSFFIYIKKILSLMNQKKLFKLKKIILNFLKSFFCLPLNAMIYNYKINPMYLFISPK
jgi:hypothetical protein